MRGFEHNRACNLALGRDANLFRAAVGGSFEASLAHHRFLGYFRNARGNHLTFFSVISVSDVRNAHLTAMNSHVEDAMGGGSGCSRHEKKPNAAASGKQAGMPSPSAVNRRASERKGIRMAAFAKVTPLLLVVHRSALGFLTFGIGRIDCDCAAFAIGRDHNMGRKDNLTAFFGSYVERPGVKLFHRPRVLIRIARRGIIFPVELAGPLTMRSRPVRRGAINGDFYAVTGSLVDNRVVLG